MMSESGRENFQSFDPKNIDKKGIEEIADSLFSLENCIKVMNSTIHDHMVCGEIPIVEFQNIEVSNSKST